MTTVGLVKLITKALKNVTKKSVLTDLGVVSKWNLLSRDNNPKQFICCPCELGTLTFSSENCHA